MAPSGQDAQFSNHASSIQAQGLIKDCTFITHSAEDDSYLRDLKEDDSYLRDLSLTDPRDDKSRIERTKGGLLKDSYRWILDHPDFQRWRDDDQSRLLWIKGDPGKGKTMLLIGIVNELETRLAQLEQAQNSTSPATVLAYFFCQGTDSNLNNATAILRGLIFHLVIRQPSLKSHLRKEYKQFGSKLFEGTNSFEALSRILSDMLRDPSLERAYIVIDALDECGTGLWELLKFVVENTSTSRVKWIVSSRNERKVEEPLEFAGHKALSLELNAKSIAAAVDVYIHHKVSELAQLKKYDSGTEGDVRDYLRMNADSTFLWVALVCQNLEKIRPKKVLKTLEAFPPGLDSLYGRMMEQIRNQEDKDDVKLCTRILAAVTLVYRPVALAELASLVESQEDDSDDAESLKEVIGLCGSFLTVRDDRVYIVHQSAKDYLSGKATITSSSDHGEADRKKFLSSLEATAIIFPSGAENVHRDIFLRSLQTMSCTLKRDIYGLRNPGFSIDDLEIPVPDPLASVRYSCVHWIDHLCEAKHREDLVDGGKVHKFLEGFLLYWIEALSLCKAMTEGIFAVAKLERLLKTTSSESPLLSLTLDAHRFLFSNGGIIKISPLQTYVSALLFTPTRSLTRERFQDKEPEWVSIKPAIEEGWGSLIKTLEGHGRGVSSVSFSHDGKLIASGSVDGTIKVWDVATGGGGDAKCIQTLNGHGDWVNSVSFSRDGKLIASGSRDRTIKVWDVATGGGGDAKCIQTLKGHGYYVRSVSFSRDGKLIASGSDDRTIKVWDVATGGAIQTLNGHGDWVNSVSFSRDGKLIASGSGDMTIKVWDVATGGGGDAKCIQTLNGHGGGVSSVSFSHDGKLIASGSADGTIKVWDVATGGGGDAKCIQTLRGHGGGVYSVSFSRDGKLIASGSGDTTIKVWDVATGGGGDAKCIQTLEGHGGGVYSVSFSHDGKLIASGSGDRTIKVWDVATGGGDAKCIQTLKGHGEWVSSVSFSRDGKLIASGSGDETIKVWDVATGGDAIQTLDVGTTIETISFDTSASYLLTDIGRIDLNIGHIDAQNPTESKQCGYGLSPDKSWIIWDGQKVLWLPPEYRPVTSTWYFASPLILATATVATVAIGCRSGRVVIIGLKRPPLP